MPITAAAVSRWIVQTIKLAYSMAEKDQLLAKMANIKAHELRALATSWAAFSGVSTQDIMDAVFWRGSSTFISFYLRDMAEQEGDIFTLGPIVVAASIVGKNCQRSSR